MTMSILTMCTIIPFYCYYCYYIYLYILLYITIYRIGYETRHVHDWTDHVWVEYYSHYENRYIHCDSCENSWDGNNLYEAGWGKQLNLMVAISKDEVVDVTRRYTRK